MCVCVSSVGSPHGMKTTSLYEGCIHHFQHSNLIYEMLLCELIFIKIKYYENLKHSQKCFS